VEAVGSDAKFLKPGTELKVNFAEIVQFPPLEDRESITGL
jgi:hypothetical protein